jgi:hypothetical protein
VYEKEIELIEHVIFKYPRTEAFLAAWQTLKSAVLGTTPNNREPKLPTVEHTIESIHSDTKCWNEAVGKYPLWIAMIRLCHEFIVRQLSATR